MGSPKALLRDALGVPFVVRAAAYMMEGGLSRIVVVTGFEHESIASALRSGQLPFTPEVVRNPDPDRGQLSSLWSAMDEITDDTEAIVVTLVDVPLVLPSTVRLVIDAWRQSRAPIVRPAVGIRRGHPVVFDRAVFEELRRTPIDAGARVVVRAHAHDELAVPVDDPGCIVDIDTAADYRELLRPKPGA